MAERSSLSLRAINPAVTRAAEQWLARQDRGLIPTEISELAAWRAATPEHASELDRITVAWRAADGIKADASLVELARQIDLATLREQRLRRQRRARFGWAGGLAAAAAAVILVWIRPGMQDDTDVAGDPAATALVVAPGIEVVPRSARRLTLPDGSVAEVRGASDVQTAFTVTERRIRLTGEAHFFVRKDPTRPFVVETRGAAVRAVGTAFNVRQEKGGVEVVVTEGMVSVQDRNARPAGGASTTTLTAGNAARVSAGQRARLPASSAPAAPATIGVEQLSPAEIEQALAWQSTRLVLNRAALGDAIAAFNVHGGTRLTLGDESLRNRLLSGTFRVENSEAFVRLLEQAAEVRVERRADGSVVLHPAR